MGLEQDNKKSIIQMGIIIDEQNSMPQKRKRLMNETEPPYTKDVINQYCNSAMRLWTKSN